MRNKLFLLILFVLSAITVFTDWSDPQIVWLYGNCYYPPVMSNSLSGDNSGNIYTVWYDLSMDFYMNITMREHNGSSWQPYQRVDDPLNGQGDYGLSWMPSISVSPDGKYLIAWEDYRTGNFEIHSKFYNGVDVPSQIQLTADSSYCWYPKLQYANGKHHLFYMSDKTGYFNIYHASFDSSWSSMESVTAQNKDILDFHYHVTQDSTILMVYTSFIDNNIGLFAKIYDNGLWSDPQALINSQYNIFTPVVVYDGLSFYIMFKSHEEGISRIGIIKGDGFYWDNPHIISPNYCNAYYPSGFVDDSVFYAYYVTDDIPTGVIRETKFNKNSFSIFEDNQLIKEKGGEIYYPQTCVDSDGDINLLFVCTDTIHGTYPATLFFMENVNGVKMDTDIKPYKFNLHMKSLVFSDNERYDVKIIDKTGRTIHTALNVKNSISFEKVSLKNDIYYLLIKSEKNKFTEKILWLD